MTRLAAFVWWPLALAWPVMIAYGIIGWTAETRIGLSASPDAAGQLIVTEVRPGGLARAAGAESGDVLLEVDGIPVSGGQWANGEDRGESFLVRKSDGSLVSRLDAQPSGKTLFSAPLVISFVVISVSFALISVLIYSRGNRPAQINVLSLQFLIAAIVFAVAPATASFDPLAQRIEYLSTDWTVALFLIFFATFAASALQGKHPCLVAFSAGIVVAAIALDTLYLVSVTAMPELYALVRQIGFAYLAAGLLGGLAILAFTYIRAESPIVKEQLRVMVFGITAAVLPFVLLTALPVTANMTPITMPEIAILPVILVPLSFGYAIMRYQLMGIRRFVHRGAAYGIITFAGFLIYGGMIAILQWAGGPDISENAAVQLLLLITLFAALPFISGTRRVAFAAVDHLLYKDFVDHAELNRRISIRAVYASGVGDLANRVLGTIAHEMRLSYAAFAEIDGDEATITAGVGQLPVSLPGEHQDAFPRVPGRAVISKTLDDEFSSSLMLIWLPRKSDKKWLMCLGPKQTEEPFKKDDITLAESIAGQISTILDNLELLEQMKTQTIELRELNRQIVTTQEEERARVASYLHDEPLQEVSNVLWQARVEEVSPEIIEKLEKINDDLRNFSKMLHPAVLENLGLVKALDWLAEEAEQSADFVVETQFVGLPEDEELEKQTQIALYRIVQESLTNCQKHSLASTVCLRLSIDGDIITLVIEDDGVGIQTGGRNEPSMRLGLIGMRERAQQLRGRLRVVDRKPTGTKVIATLPAVYKRSEQRMSIPSVEVEQLD